MDSHQLFLLIAASMGLILLLDLISGSLRKGWISEPMVALLLGWALGPKAIGLLDLSKLGDPHVLLKHAAQLTLAIGLMGVALRIPPLFYSRFPRTISILLLVGMVLMWASASAVAYFTLGIPFMTALLLGAIVTPTDPVISTSIITGKTAEHNLPLRLRHSISAESGFNDGLAFPLVMLPIALMSTDTTGAGIHQWFLSAWFQKTFLGIIIGAGLGALAGWIMHVARKKDEMGIKSLLSYSVALSLTSLAAAHLAGTNGIIAAFVAGVAFARVAKPGERADEENVQEAVNRFFTLPIFLLLGVATPWADWISYGWNAVAFVILLLLLRRPPAWAALTLIIPCLRFREMVFAGWFGPVGIAALYYALHADEMTHLKVLWPMTSLAICASVVIYGATAAPFARLLGRRDRELRNQHRKRQENR